MKGYKVFKPDWTCRGFQYSVGKVFEEDITPICCKRGFHFCTELKECFSYYSFNPNNKVAEVEALGDIDTEPNMNKHCTNIIKIVRELSWEDVLKMLNTGKANTGRCNTGNYNSGNYNCGDWNSGNYNNGHYNSGSHNSGHWNKGDCNSGHWNIGSHNSGDSNRGDWNKTNFSSGCFNTKELKILMFNKPSDWTLRDWCYSEAKNILKNIPNNVLRWIQSDDMIDEEKEQHPEYKTTGGYLKEMDNSKCVQAWWDSLLDHEKDIIKSLPNFNAEIFKEITGIDVNISSN